MVDLIRTYVVPLRKKTKLAPRWRRSKKAMRVLKEFVEKHMKCENIIVCAELNVHIWNRGAKNPPGKVEIVCHKTTLNKKEMVLVNLKSVGIKEQLDWYEVSKQIPKVEKEEKKETKNTDSKIQDITAKEVEKKPAVVKEKKEEEKVKKTKEVAKE